MGIQSILSIPNFHYYFISFVGLFIWSANYIMSPKHENLLANNYSKNFILVRGITILLFIFLFIDLIIFFCIPNLYLLLIFGLISFSMLYIILLTFFKNIYNPKIYHNVIFKNNKKIKKIRLIEDKDNKYLILKNEELIFISKDKIKKITFFEEKEEIKN